MFIVFLYAKEAKLQRGFRKPQWTWTNK